MLNVTKITSENVGEIGQNMRIEDIKFSNEWLVSLYDRLNSVVFGDRLPNLKVRWSSRLKRSLGRTSWIQYYDRTVLKEIVIAKSYIEVYPELLIDVMLHEMIHAYFPYGVGHGEEFQRVRKLFNRVYGTNIKTAVDGYDLPDDYYYIVQCKECKTVIKRAKRFDYSKYRCGACNGKLEEVK